MLLATVVRCSLRTDFVTIPTDLERCWKDDQKDKEKEQSVSNASIEAIVDLNLSQRQKVKNLLDLCDSTEGVGNSTNLLNLLDAVRHRPGSVDQIHHRDACIHCCSPGTTTLSS
jgi:hypothetical protein